MVCISFEHQDYYKQRQHNLGLHILYQNYNKQIVVEVFYDFKDL